MLYHLYELNQAALSPARAAAEAYRLLFRNPLKSGVSHAARPGRCRCA
jgi:poly-beta-hydroxyalkanoate depolymerase